MSTPDPGKTPDRGGDLLDSGMGPLTPDGITGGKLKINQKPGVDHISIHGDVGHFSFDVDEDGASDVHGTLHGPTGKKPW